MTAKKVKLH